MRTYLVCIQILFPRAKVLTLGQSLPMLSKFRAGQGYRSGENTCAELKNHTRLRLDLYPSKHLYLGALTEATNKLP